jgi:hypothetical protein
MKPSHRGVRIFACWNTERNVVAYTTSTVASGVMPATTTRQKLNSAVQPIMSNGLNQNAPYASIRSALWCIWWKTRQSRLDACIARCQAYTPASYTTRPATAPQVAPSAVRSSSRYAASQSFHNSGRYDDAKK